MSIHYRVIRGKIRTTPAFTHTSSLAPAKTTRIGWSARETGAETMAVLVNNDTGFQVTIAVWQGGVPKIHAHATIRAIGWGHEVGVVVARTVLRVGDDSVVLGATTTEVVLLEVTRDLVEAVAGSSISTTSAGSEATKTYRW